MNLPTPIHVNANARLMSRRKYYGKKCLNLLGNIGECGIFCVCLPCICCYLCFGGRTGSSRRTCTREQREREEYQARRKKDVPRPLPEVRERSLSQPLPEGIQIKSRWKKRQQQSLGQEQSLLMSKLPIELRLQIWEYVVGGNTLHMVSSSMGDGKKQRLNYVKCERYPFSAPTVHYLCPVRWGKYSTPQVGVPFGPCMYPDRFSSDKAVAQYWYEIWRQEKRSPLWLLLTCRQMFVLSSITIKSFSS